MAVGTYLKAALSISIFLAAVGGAAASPPAQATNPNPADGAFGVSVDANLVWVRGDGADEDEVYFGTDPCALPKVAIIYAPDPSLYNPGDPNLVASTTYYWQVVEVNGLDRYEGPVWKFTTVRGEAEPNKPLDGALIKGDTSGDNLYTKLIFTPGATTVEWKGYFNEDYSKVATRHPDASLGPPRYPSFPYTYWVGYPGVPPEDTLVRGNKYYWTVDSNDAKGNTFYGDVWEFSIQGYKAFEPSPPNEAMNVSTIVLLSWLPGFGVEDHDIYMGTSWEDVNNAVYDFYNPPPEFVATRSEPNYHIYYLLDDTKYYWRVDQVNGRMHPSIGGGTYYKGDVWCFTTLDFCGCCDSNFVGWWKFDMGSGVTAWDWSGYDNHGTLMGDPQWVTDGRIDGAMDFDGSGDYIWTGRSASALGIAGSHAKTAAAWVFTREFNNGGIWDLGAHSDSQEFCLRTLDTDNQWRVQYGGDADHDFTYDSLNKWVHFALVFDPPSHSICYVDGFVISEVNDAPLSTSNANPFQIGCYGWQNDYFNGIIDEVRLYNKALSQQELIMWVAPPEAWRPRPYDGQVSVPITVTLQWIPGRYADQHDVYIGTNFDDVNKAFFDPFNPSPVFLDTVSEPNILVNPLAVNTKYYWRVDEVFGREPPDFIPSEFYKGDVWSFTTVSGEAQCYYPEDGAVIPGDTKYDNIYTKLIFIPGATAVEWKGYFSDDYSKVESRAEDAKIPPPIIGPPYTYIVPPLGGSLIRGQVYYWTVDSNDSFGNTFLGDVWEFTIQDFKAFEPSPPNEALLISTTPLLSWCPGFSVEEHDIYIGTSWEDVNNAFYDPHYPRPPEFVATRSEPNYQVVTPLPSNTKMYWRVDEVVGRSPPDFIPTEFYKGNVWCFTTEVNRIFVDIDATGANNGTSWENAYNFLQDALANANSSQKPVEISVAEGIYTPDSNSANPNGSGDRMATFQLINGVTLKGGYAGFGEANPDARDIELYETILSGDLDGNDVDVSDPCDLPVEPTRGENSYHVVTSRDCNETAILDGFTISGGHIDEPFLDPNEGGGGLLNISSSPTVTGCTFSANYAREGGGMYNWETSCPAVTDCTFRANNARGSGGGMDSAWYSNPTVSNCTFRANTSKYGGGGICNRVGSSPTVANCTFNKNTAFHGGGIENWYSCSPKVDNCIFVGNQAEHEGGGMSNWESSSPTVTNCTFTGNLVARFGGAIFNERSSCILTNCILWGDTPDEIYENQGVTVITYSNIKGSWPGEGNIDADPCFVDANGGNLRLSSDSPCIDAGYNNAPNLPAMDLDGHPRIIDGDCNDTEVVDIGAYEFNYAYMGDFDYNCRVNFTDLSIFGLAWMSQPGDFNWDFACNINIPADKVINKLDLATFVDNWLAGF